jgi:hypothetical protein
MMSSFVVAPREIVGLDSWSIFLVAMCHQIELVSTVSSPSDLINQLVHAFDHVPAMVFADRFLLS